MARHYHPRYRRWYRPSHGSVNRPVALVAAALLALGAAGTAGQVTHHHHHGHHPAAPHVIVAVAAGHGPQSWAQDFLASARLPRTSCNLAAVVAWIGAEGSNPAWFNPLDTTQPEPGSYPINSVKVQAFRSRASGLGASVTTLYNGYYPGIIAAFRAAKDAQAVADAVAASPWGTQPFSVSC